MELILIDSGLVNKAGHSYTLAKTVSGALARRKLRHRIFGLSGLDTSIAAEIGAIPHFSRSLYDGVDFSWGEKRLRSVAAIFRGAPAGRSTLSERRTWKALNETFERDLEALPADIWQPNSSAWWRLRKTRFLGWFASCALGRATGFPASSAT